MCVRSGCEAVQALWAPDNFCRLRAGGEAATQRILLRKKLSISDTSHVRADTHDLMGGAGGPRARRSVTVLTAPLGARRRRPFIASTRVVGGTGATAIGQERGERSVALKVSNT